MPLLPYPWDDFRPFRPSRLLDQQFGVGLQPEDLLLPFTVQHGSSQRPFYYRPWRRTGADDEDAGSVVSFDKDKFQVNLDVQHFAPDEITVKMTGNDTITVEGKHEEKRDEHGFISRRFVRKYVMPEGHDVQKVASNLSSDGVLTITAPKIGGPPSEERAIPITQTGVPLKSVEAKKEEKEAEK